MVCVGVCVWGHPVRSSCEALGHVTVHLSIADGSCTGCTGGIHKRVEHHRCLPFEVIQGNETSFLQSIQLHLYEDSCVMT